MGGSFAGDLGALWPETWYFLGSADFDVDEDSAGDPESRSRREEVDALERRGAFEILGNLGDAELDTSGEFMLILVCDGQRIIVWTTCLWIAVQKRQRASVEALDGCLLLPSWRVCEHFLCDHPISPYVFSSCYDFL